MYTLISVCVCLWFFGSEEKLFPGSDNLHMPLWHTTLIRRCSSHCSRAVCSLEVMCLLKGGAESSLYVRTVFKQITGNWLC